VQAKRVASTASETQRLKAVPVANDRRQVRTTSHSPLSLEYMKVNGRSAPTRAYGHQLQVQKVGLQAVPD
jgi:hypothetical protein